MSGTVSFFNLQARQRRRDQTVEETISELSSLRQILQTDEEHRDLFAAIQAVKKLRRPEVVDRIDAQRLARADR